VYEIKVTVESLIGTGALNLNTAGFPEIGNSVGDNTLLHTATSSALIIYSTIYTDEINISNISIKDVTNGIPQTGLMSYNKPMLFDGVDDYVSIDGDITMTASDNFTLSAWVAPSKNSSTHLVSDENSTTNGRIILKADNALNHGRVEIVGGSASVTYSSVDGIANEKLDFMTFVFRQTSGELELFINAVSEGVLSWAAGSFVINNIGKEWGGGTGITRYDGYLNEVSIFDTALTADEVSELYNNGTALSALEHSKVDNLQGYWRNDGDDVWVDRTPVLGAELSDIDNANLPDDGWEVLDGKATWDGSGDTTDYLVSIITASSMFIDRTYSATLTVTNYQGTNDLGFSSTGGLVNNLKLSANGSITYEFVWDGSALQLFGRDTNSATLEISVKEVKGGNDGTVNGSPESILLPEARNGRDTLGFPINNVNNGYLALHGDGYVEVADDASLDPSADVGMTMECWVRATETPTGYDVLMISELSGERSHGLFIHPDKLHLSISNSTGSLVGTNYNKVLILNDWYHITAVVDTTDTTHKYYINGSLEQTSAGTNDSFYNINQTLRIGEHHSNNQPFTGSIDEPRIYSRALTEAEVLQNYNAGKSKHRND